MSRAEGRPRVLVVEGLSAGSDAIYGAGGTPHTVNVWAQGAELEAAFRDGVPDGILLTGGGDVDPRRYGIRRVAPTVYGVSEFRDRVEFGIVKIARDHGIPIFGICRGAQVLNVACGGTLWQELKDRKGTKEHHANSYHGLRPRAGSIMAACLEKDDLVVSLHHQAIRQPGKGLLVTAWGDDGVPEAIESADGMVMGVQWHPEMDTDYDGVARRVLEAFVTRCAVNSGLAAPTPRWPAKRAITVIGGESPMGDRWWNHERADYEWDDEDRPIVLERSQKEWWRDKEVRDAWQQPKRYRVCPICRVEFEDRVDYDDHLYFLHGVYTQAEAEAAGSGVDIGVEPVPATKEVL
jgi:putative glutamine amidotransferase